MFLTRIVFIATLSLMLLSCKSDSTKNDITTETTDTKETEETRHQIYIVTVDNLRVREGAEKSTKVIDKLKERTIVYSEDEKSELTEKIILRNVQYDSPYRKINYNGNTGWVYGGGLYKIYDESEEDSFTETFESLVTQISSPNKSSIEKGQHIMKVLQREKSSSEEWNDIMYHLAENQLTQVAHEEATHELLNKYEWTMAEYSAASERKYDMTWSDFARSFKQAGLIFTSSEGMIEAMINPNEIAKIIEGPFSSAMDMYINIRQKETETKFFEDAGIVSPLSEITSHIITIEKFIDSYPNFPRNRKIKQELNYLHSVLLKGSDNSPAYDFDTKELNPEWSSAWDQYLNNNPNGLIVSEIKATKQKQNSK